MRQAHSNHLTALLVVETIEAFYLDRMASNIRPGTLEYYRGELAPFLKSPDLRQIACITEITPEIIRSHLLDVGRTRNPGGIHARYRAIRAWLNWTWKEYELDTRNPITRVKPPKVSTAPLPGIPLEQLFRLAGLLPPVPERTEAHEQLLFLFDKLNDSRKKDILKLSSLWAENPD